jgi:large subunit ribosomal protein L4
VVAAPKAPLLGISGKSSKEATLDEDVFGADLKPHLVHEAVRSELNARRAGTQSAKTRGLVAGGRGKPWRQKGTGRARAGTIRAPQFVGGGVVFAPEPRGYSVKVNRKAYRSALRGALSAHAAEGTIAVVDGSAFDEPSTKKAASFLEAWGKEHPVLLVANEDETGLVKSFRNLDRVVVVPPSEVEVAGVVWARALLVSEAALESVQGRAAESLRGGTMSLHPNEVLLAPVVSEKSYSLIEDRKYSFRVHQDAHKTQVRQAVEQLFGVKVISVNMVKVPSKPKMRNYRKGTRPGWKKAIVQLREGDSIEIFEGAQV